MHFRCEINPMLNPDSVTCSLILLPPHVGFHRHFSKMNSVQYLWLPQNQESFYGYCFFPISRSLCSFIIGRTQWSYFFNSNTCTIFPSYPHIPPPLETHLWETAKSQSLGYSLHPLDKWSHSAPQLRSYLTHRVPVMYSYGPGLQVLHVYYSHFLATSQRRF